MHVQARPSHSSAHADARPPGHAASHAGERGSGHAASHASERDPGHASPHAGERSTGHPGRRRADKKKRSGISWQGVGLLAAAALASVAWFFLVRSAIDFGRAAMDGQQIGWVFTVAGTLGATACLVLVFSLVHRALRAFGLVSENHGHRAAGRHGKH